MRRTNTTGQLRSLAERLTLHAQARRANRLVTRAAIRWASSQGRSITTAEGIRGKAARLKWLLTGR